MNGQRDARKDLMTKVDEWRDQLDQFRYDHPNQLAGDEPAISDLRSAITALHISLTGP
jgi:hypothetical protein